MSNPLAELLWSEFRGVCEAEVSKVQAQLGDRLTDEMRARLRAMADEITIGLVARCLDAVGRAKSDEERARTIEMLIRTFGRERLRGVLEPKAG